MILLFCDDNDNDNDDLWWSLMINPRINRPSKQANDELAMQSVFFVLLFVCIYVTIINLFQLNWRTIVAFGVWKFLIIYHLVGPMVCKQCWRPRFKLKAPWHSHMAFYGHVDTQGFQKMCFLIWKLPVWDPNTVLYICKNTDSREFKALSFLSQPATER